MIEPTRAMGTLKIGGGLVVRAVPQQEDRTDITLTGDIDAGAIVRDPDSGRWRYDDKMREVFGIGDNPDFATDGEAGKKLRKLLSPVEWARLSRWVGDELRRRGMTLENLQHELGRG